MKKRFLAVLLTICMTLCFFSTTAFAEEGDESTIPENATRHTIAVSLQPQSEYNANFIVSEDTATPYVWGDPSITLIDNYVGYTGQFYLSDRYFAYEMQGFLDGNSGVNEAYAVALEYVGGGVITSLSARPDWTLYKNDWITINVDGNYRFKITNGTDYILTVYITYYSWN